MFTIEELATIPLFSTLGDKEPEYLAGAVEGIHLIAGEYVGHEGEGRSGAVRSRNERPGDFRGRRYSLWISEACGGLRR